MKKLFISMLTLTFFITFLGTGIGAMLTRINFMESALDRKNPEVVIKMFSNPQNQRNGAIFYAIVTDDLKQSVINATYSHGGFKPILQKF